MARMNISISNDLKQRMDTHTSVNWSQTASESFEKKINEIEITLEPKNMAEAIARLKASKAKYDDAVQTQGHQDGVGWAMKHATYEELNRLNQYYDEFMQNGHFIESGGELEDIVTGRNYDIELFDDDDPKDDPSYLEGFVDGALDVFSKVD